MGETNHGSAYYHGKEGSPRQLPWSLVVVSALQTPSLTSCMFQPNGLEKDFMEPH